MSLLRLPRLSPGPLLRLPRGPRPPRGARSASAPSAMASLDMAEIAHQIASGECKKIAFLTGAGVSVSAGIPDFRSPGGMYDTLRPELLTATPGQRQMMSDEPTAVVSWSLFSRNPLPYLELRRPFILGTAEGRWKATLAHWFVRVCYDKGLLVRLYTQNIDGLDYQTGVPEERIIPVHGTMGTASCEFCGAPYPMAQFRDAVRAGVKDIYGTDPDAPAESTPVACPSCGRDGVKPNTVLYGSNLPARFFECLDSDTADLDLLIVAGTSLTVSPANSVPTRVPRTCLRLVANRDRVGEDLGMRFGPGATRDLWRGGGCDEALLDLAELAGWLEDLRAYQEGMSDASRALLDARPPQG